MFLVFGKWTYCLGVIYPWSFNNDDLFLVETLGDISLKIDIVYLLYIYVTVDECCGGYDNTPETTQKTKWMRTSFYLFFYILFFFREVHLFMTARSKADCTV